MVPEPEPATDWRTWRAVLTLLQAHEGICCVGTRLPATSCQGPSCSPVLDNVLWVFTCSFPSAMTFILGRWIWLGFKNPWFILAFLGCWQRSENNPIFPLTPLLKQTGVFLLLRVQYFYCSVSWWWPLRVSFPKCMVYAFNIPCIDTPWLTVELPPDKAIVVDNIIKWKMHFLTLTYWTSFLRATCCQHAQNANMSLSLGKI